VRAGRRGLRPAALLLAIAAWLSAQERASDPAGWRGSAVPVLSTAEAQLAHARRLKRRPGALEGEAEARWRATTVAAYRAVRLYHPEDVALAIEAGFRAGELLRAGGDDAGALAEFRWVAAQPSAEAFGSRARMEAGHIERRRECWADALAAYLDVGADASAPAARREEAWCWAGIAWKAQGRIEEARAAWQRIRERGTDALARIRAYDELGVLALEAQDPEGAAGLLHECVERLAERALEESEEGARVRNALLRMRVVDELPRAIARRKDSSTERGTSRKS
jgi:tetratricopeptide (TPR) repeat protein